jgi:transcriptional regulator with XRE-family HTH domain
MGNDLTLVKDKKQEKFAYVQVIKKAMGLLKWNAARLSRESGVNEATLNRIFKKGRDISGDNLYRLLKCLNLLNSEQQNNFMCGWSSTEIEYCQKLKDILESGEGKETTTIKEMIDFYTDKNKDKKTRKKGTLKQTGT